MILKFNSFLESNNFELHYSAFDWDDNILHMPTVIHMEKLQDGKWVKIDVSTSDFATIRNDKENYRNLSNSFSEFRDTGSRGDSAFLEDTKVALSKGNFGPAWEAFVECLREGSLFAIITARGHEPKTIRKSVEYIIDNILSDDDKFLLYSNCMKHSYIFASNEDFDRVPKGTLSKTPLITSYLNECSFYGVTSDSFMNEFGDATSSNPEVAKERALDKFIDKCNSLGKSIGAKSVSIGFSDDDPKNVEHVRTYFKEKSALSNELMPHDVKLNLYKTTDRSIKGGERTRFHKSFLSESNTSKGMESSIMPFSQFNNIGDRMFTNGDEYDKSMKLGTRQLSKMSKDYLPKSKSNVCRICGSKKSKNKCLKCNSKIQQLN